MNMRAESKLGSLLLFFLLALPSFQASAMPTIQHWVTENGVRVYLAEAHELPMLDVRITWDAGSARDGMKHGLAKLTAEMLSEGAGGMDAGQISTEFEKLGAQFRVSTDSDSTSANLRTLTDSQSLANALHTFKLVLGKPDFPEDALQRNINIALQNLQFKKQNPGAIAYDAFQAAIYGTHPYAHPVAGEKESLQGIKRADVLNFFNNHYVAHNAILVFVGAINKKQASFIARQLFKDIPEGERAPPLPEVPSLAEERVIRISHPATQTHILLGHAALKRGDPDYFPLYLGNHILGGSGMVSLLFNEIREKRGLSYSVYSYFMPRRQAGPFIAGLQTKGNQAEQALQVLQDNIRRFTSAAPSEKELDAAKKNITGGFPLRVESNSSILEYVSMIAFYDLPLDYLDTFRDNINSISPEQIQDAFARRLNPDAFVVVMAGGDNNDSDDPSNGNGVH
ncbi:MAG: M16 family metallopeptidase [Candidatus Eutrophobiaceae bacterium]